MNYRDPKFGDNLFDGVYAMEILVHATDLKEALNLFRVLKPGAVIAHFEYDHDHTDQTGTALGQINGYASMPAFQQFNKGALQGYFRRCWLR
jgi:ubiquinone/menaquinone biosynthesis C-methylase UbiE